MGWCRVLCCRRGRLGLVVGEVLLMTLRLGLWSAGRLKMGGRVCRVSDRLRSHQLGGTTYLRTFKEME